MKATENNVPRQRVPLKYESGRVLRLMKWLVLIVLLVLLLVALFLPDRGLAAPDPHPPEGETPTITPLVR